MAGSSSVLSDNSTLSKLDRGLEKLEIRFALLSGLAAFSLMGLAVVNVGGRNGFGTPLPGYIDWIEQIMPLIAFMGISYCQRLGGHIRMDIAIGQLKGRALWAAEFLSVFIMLLLMLLLVWGSYSHFERSFDFNAPLWSRDSSFDINLPIWPAKLLVPIAFSVICLRLGLQLWGFGRAFALGLERPVAVPLIEDASTIAANEAATVSGFDDDADQAKKEAN